MADDSLIKIYDDELTSQLNRLYNEKERMQFKPMVGACVGVGV